MYGIEIIEVTDVKEREELMSLSSLSSASETWRAAGSAQLRHVVSLAVVV